MSGAGRRRYRQIKLVGAENPVMRATGALVLPAQGVQHGPFGIKSAFSPERTVVSVLTICVRRLPGLPLAGCGPEVEEVFWMVAPGQ
jgi:hypothetical protein